MTRPSPGSEHSDRGDELLGYFFPRRRARDVVVSGARRTAEVLLVLVLVVLATSILLRVWQWLDAAWSSWRLAAMSTAVVDGDGMAEDLAVASAAVVEHHPRLAESGAASEWTLRLRDIRASLAEGGSSWDLFVELAPAVAEIGCGHTVLLPPEGWINLLARGGWVLPVEIRFFGSRAFVTAHYADGVDLPLGAEVLAIDGRSITEIRRRLVAATSSDGSDGVYANAMLDQAFFFHHARYFGTARHHTIRYLPPRESAPREMAVPSCRGGDVGERYWRRYPERHPQRPPFPVHGRVAGESGVAYLWIPTFSLERARGWKETLHRFFDDLEEAGVHTLVMDLRGNGGGPSPLAVELVEHLVAEPFVFLREPVEPEYADLPVFKHFSRVIMPHSDTAFRGELFVLIDGGSFSTTGHLCAVLREHRRVHFVGGTAGGGATCFDNPVTVELPNSRLRLRVARTTFSVQASESSIEPEVAVGPALDDVLAGRDTVLADLGERLGADLEGARAALASDVSVIPPR